MRFNFLALAALWPAAILGAPNKRHGDSDLVTNRTVFHPPANYNDPRVLYARSVQLKSGDLLATWENYSPGPELVHFPIYKSKDNGKSWKEFSKVKDTVNGWGLRYQPFLYVLPEKIGQFPKGTVLLAGSSIPTDLSKTQIEVYASRDNGKTWKFVSHVVSGGEAIPNNGLTPVWEPFLMAYKGKLICFYADQTDPKYGQKLSHKVSLDLKTWGAPVDDVVDAVYTARPGMSTVTKLPNGKYMMLYENGGGPGFDRYAFPLTYRISASPLEFNSSVAHPLRVGAVQPTGSPYVTWSPVGGKHGTIIASAGDDSQIFVNRALGAVDAWEMFEVPEGISYSRHIRVLDDPNKLLIMGGGILPPAVDNSVTVSVIDLKKGLKNAQS